MQVFPEVRDEDGKIVYDKKGRAKRYSKRDGSDHDRDQLQKTFKELNFVVEAYDDLSRNEVVDKITEGNSINCL